MIWAWGLEFGYGCKGSRFLNTGEGVSRACGDHGLWETRV